MYIKVSDQKTHLREVRDSYPLSYCTGPIPVPMVPPVGSIGLTHVAYSEGARVSRTPETLPMSRDEQHTVKRLCWGLNSPEPHCGRLFRCQPAEAELRYGVVADVADGVLWTDMTHGCETWSLTGTT